MIRSLPPGKRKLVTPYRIFVSVALSAAAAAMYVGFTNSVDHSDQTATSQFVTLVRPPPNGLALRQTRVFAQLASAYTGVLQVDGVEIPEDQLDHLEGINTVGFTPGPGTETGVLEPGRRCATVVYWKITEGREASAASYNWCWQVH